VVGELEEGEGWVDGGFSRRSSVFARGIFVIVPAFIGVRGLVLELNGVLKVSCGIPITLSHLPPPLFALVFFPPQSSEIGKKDFP
jgi:hypothetical protein